MEQIGAGLVKQLALGRIPVIAPNENQKTGLFCRHSGRRVRENARTLLRVHHPMQHAHRLHQNQRRQQQNQRTSQAALRISHDAPCRQRSA